MNSFSVGIEPLPAAVALLNAPLDIKSISTMYNYDSQIDVDIFYTVNGQNFGYHPSNAILALGDVNTEWQLAKSRESHLMTLSGYPVLEIQFDEDRAMFFDPSEVGHPKCSLGDSIEARQVEAEFARATSYVWGIVSRSSGS